MKKIIKKFDTFKTNENFEESQEDIELRKIERWVRDSGNAGADFLDWEWDGDTLTITTEDGEEIYSREDLQDEGVLEPTTHTYDNVHGMIADMELIIKTLHINPSLVRKAKEILKYLNSNLDKTPSI